MSTDRVRLSTGATTLIRAPLTRGKSHASNAQSWAALGGKSRMDLQASGDVIPVYDSSGAILSAAASLAPGASWQAAAATAAANGAGGSVPSIIDHLAHPLTAAATAGHYSTAPGPPAPTGPGPGSGAGPAGSGAGSGPLRSRLAGGPSSRTLVATSQTHAGVLAGGGPGPGGAPAAMAPSFRRRNGIASAPSVTLPRAPGAVPAGNGGGGGPGGMSTSVSGVPSDADRAGGRRLLPAIGGGPRATPPMRAESPPPAVNAAPSRRTLVSLPSIAVVISGGEPDGDEDEPIVVSFAQPAPARTSTFGRAAALRAGPSRPGKSLAAAVTANSGGATGNDDDDSTSDSASAYKSVASRPAHLGGAGALRAGGTRRFLGVAAAAAAGGSASEPGSTAAAGADTTPPTARSAPPPGIPSRRTLLQLDDTAPLDDTASGGGEAAIAAQLTSRHLKERDRVNRVRYTLLADASPGVTEDGEAVATPGGTSSGSAEGMSGSGAAAGPGPGTAGSPSKKTLKVVESMEPHETRSSSGGGGLLTRSGKSFTQRALEDPHNPISKTAKQLAALQEQLSYMDDSAWREKAAESVAMERPLLMAEGWKV